MRKLAPNQLGRVLGGNSADLSGAALRDNYLARPIVRCAGLMSAELSATNLSGGVTPSWVPTTGPATTGGEL